MVRLDLSRFSRDGCVPLNVHLLRFHILLHSVHSMLTSLTIGEIVKALRSILLTYDFFSLSLMDVITCFMYIFVADIIINGLVLVSHIHLNIN